MITKTAVGFMDQQYPQYQPMPQEDTGVAKRTAKGILGGYIGALSGAGIGGIISKGAPIRKKLFMAPNRLAKALAAAGAVAGVAQGADIDIPEQLYRFTRRS